MDKSYNTPKGVKGSGLPLESLPLFRWAILCPNEQFLEIPRPARLIAQRFAMPAIRARVIAELAGFKLEDSANV
jgi:hypothetical protein